MNSPHPYDQFANQKDSSERQHLVMLAHFTNPISFEVFKKTPAEKIELATRIRNYPNKNHRPIPPNN